MRREPDLVVIAEDARVVRDAMKTLADSELAGVVKPTLRDVSLYASDALLAELRRMVQK